MMLVLPEALPDVQPAGSDHGALWSWAPTDPLLPRHSNGGSSAEQTHFTSLKTLILEPEGVKSLTETHLLPKPIKLNITVLIVLPFNNSSNIYKQSISDL